ncbi:MAG: hypothetical protein ABFD75_12380 [Smithella sp.]
MRADTWDVDLMNFIKSRRKTPFQWGAHDCTLFAVDCAKVMTGIDLAEKYRGYTTETGAALIIGRAGSLKDLINETLSAFEISPKMARRGDWILFDNEGAEAVGVCIGTMFIAAGMDGLIMREMSDAITAWRID